VESKESPCHGSSSDAAAAIRERESKAKFVGCIEDATKELVGRYNITEHNAY
jgi:hypothetical protein